MSVYLITGVAGFIGFHLALRLLEKGETVVGVDNLNDYYDVNLKLARLRQIEGHKAFRFVKLDLADSSALAALCKEVHPRRIVNLAAQAGVRHSIDAPQAYINSNLLGFANVLEAARHAGVEHFVYASSSSVYGANTKVPFSVQDSVDHPISLYAATKKANELMAHSYSHLYRLPTTGLRFFTVYGPWGRPDMAYFLFTKAIREGRPISLFNQGSMRRDFTYIDDVIEGVMRVIEQPASPNPAWSGEHPDVGTSLAPYRIYNIGNHSPVELSDFVRILEKCLGQEAIKQLLPMQPGDVQTTYADVSDLYSSIGFKPSIPIEVGIGRFVEWYRAYYERSDFRPRSV